MGFLDLTGLTRFTTKMKDWVNGTIDETVSGINAEIDDIKDDISDVSTSFSTYKHTAIPTNADLNSFSSAGHYSCSNSTIGRTLTNCPVQSAFAMQVYQKGTYCIQVIFTRTTIYFRDKTSSGWDHWFKIVGTEIT